MLAAGKEHLVSHHKSASYAPCEVKWKVSKVPYLHPPRPPGCFREGRMTSAYLSIRLSRQLPYGKAVRQLMIFCRDSIGCSAQSSTYSTLSSGTLIVFVCPRSP